MYYELSAAVAALLEVDINKNFELETQFEVNFMF